MPLQEPCLEADLVPLAPFWAEKEEEEEEEELLRIKGGAVALVTVRLMDCRSRCRPMPRCPNAPVFILLYMHTRHCREPAFLLLRCPLEKAASGRFCKHP